MNAAPQLDPAKIAKGLTMIRSPWKMAAFQGAKMPLGIAAGLRIDAIDETSCTVSLPGGWRTQNPFGSLYWAAQGMAAEMATGLHAYVLREAAPVPVGMILAGCEGSFTKMGKGRCRFVFDQGEKVADVIGQALATGERLTCATDVVGYDPAGDEISRWVFTWSFRAKLG